MAIPYRKPRNWISYDAAAIAPSLTEAKAAMMAVSRIPYQRSWADELQRIQLKREVAGTSRIEGADFTERELDAALQETPEQLQTRSQRQAASAAAMYRWLAGEPGDGPVNVALIGEVHRRLVTGCDDDHCPPGQPRGRGANVTFGNPRHRGVEGGEECREAMAELAEAARTVFRAHDPLVQALALHYHFAAMHPFLDGNGRTARALEALMLRRAGLRDTLFIAMSNYYYDEKAAYLGSLAEAGAGGHDLTPFLKFGLKGIETQCRRLFEEIRHHVAKALFRNTMTDLFGRLRSPRKRVMSGRHIEVLGLLLEEDGLSLAELTRRTAHLYALKNPRKALVRDLNYLLHLGALRMTEDAEPRDSRLHVDLEWPTRITETEFFRRARELPRAKVHGFLSS